MFNSVYIDPAGSFKSPSIKKNTNKKICIYIDKIKNTYIIFMYDQSFKNNVILNVHMQDQSTGNWWYHLAKFKWDIGLKSFSIT